MKANHWLLALMLAGGCSQMQTAKDQAEVAAKQGQDAYAKTQKTIKDTQDSIKSAQEAMGKAQKQIDEGKQMFANGSKAINDFADRFRSDWDKLNRQLDGLTQLSSNEDIAKATKMAKDMRDKLKKEQEPEAKKKLAEVQAQLNRLVATSNLKAAEQKWTKAVKDLGGSLDNLTDTRLKNADFRKTDDNYHNAQRSYETAWDKVKKIQGTSQ